MKGRWLAAAATTTTVLFATPPARAQAQAQVQAQPTSSPAATIAPPAPGTPPSVTTPAVTTPAVTTPSRPAHPRVRVTIDPCVQVDALEVRRIVAIELGAELADEGATDPALTHVAAACEGDAVVLRVDDPLTHKSLARAVRLEHSAARARLLAIAMTELVTASWIELEATPAPAVAPATETPTTPEDRAAAREVVRARVPALGPREPSPLRVIAPPAGPQPPRVRITLAAGLRAFVATDGIALYGASARLETALRGVLGLHADLSLEYGARAVLFGRTHVGASSVGAALTLRRPLGGATLYAGVGARGGALLVVGESTDARVEGGTSVRAWGGPMVLVGASAPLSRRVSLGGSVEAGYSIGPNGARSAGQRVLALDGVWLGANVGIGF